MEKDAKFWQSISPFELSEPDIKSLLTQKDEDFPPHTWQDLKDAIEEKDLGRLTRYPTDMRRYVLWRREVKSTYPDISKFIITNRLHWPLPTDQGFDIQNPTPFANPADYRLLRNDWPYAVHEDVRHVVIWLKTRIDVDEQGEPTPESQRLMDEFVEKTFRSRLTSENSRADAEVIGFKNPTRWQSVRTLEHIHVLTRGVDDSFIEELTGQREDETIGKSWKSGERVS